VAFYTLFAGRSESTCREWILIRQQRHHSRVFSCWDWHWHWHGHPRRLARKSTCLFSFPRVGHARQSVPTRPTCTRAHTCKRVL